MALGHARCQHLPVAAGFENGWCHATGKIYSSWLKLREWQVPHHRQHLRLVADGSRMARPPVAPTISAFHPFISKLAVEGSKTVDINADGPLPATAPPPAAVSGRDPMNPAAPIVPMPRRHAEDRGATQARREALASVFLWYAARHRRGRRPPTSAEIDPGHGGGRWQLCSRPPGVGVGGGGGLFTTKTRSPAHGEEEEGEGKGGMVQ